MTGNQVMLTVIWFFWVLPTLIKGISLRLPTLYFTIRKSIQSIFFTFLFSITLYSHRIISYQQNPPPSGQPTDPTPPPPPLIWLLTILKTPFIYLLFIYLFHVSNFS